MAAQAANEKWAVEEKKTNKRNHLHFKTRSLPARVITRKFDSPKGACQHYLPVLQHDTQIMVSLLLCFLLLQWNPPEWPPLLKRRPPNQNPDWFLISQIAISETFRKQPPPVSDHLTKISIGSSVSQIAISETSCKQPPPVSDHLTKVSISSSVSQIAQWNFP